MGILYNIGIYIFKGLAHLISLFNEKYKLWINGQKGWYEKLKKEIKPGVDYIWVHCASLGEFEQGRTVIEGLKKESDQIRIILTFFSPSGYEVKKNYMMADIVCYLPPDTPGNSRKFIDLVNPSAAIFIKYEFWKNYLTILAERNIPLYLVSGIFRKDQHFFSWYGSFFRKILKGFTWIFVQDQNSLDLLDTIGLKNVSVAGDTRFDRVMEISGAARNIEAMVTFRGVEKLFIAGSSWKGDEEIICRYINSYPQKMKWVFAPHEVNGSNIERLEHLLKVKSVRLSVYSKDNYDARVLIIDNIGLLSSAYRYAHIAEVGGGFGRGIHNILEAACWGIPVLFGPNFGNFREAVELIQLGGAKSFRNYDDFKQILEGWLDNERAYKMAASASSGYVIGNSGATVKIISHITRKDTNN